MVIKTNARIMLLYDKKGYDMKYLTCLVFCIITISICIFCCSNCKKQQGELGSEVNVIYPIKIISYGSILPSHIFEVDENGVLIARDVVFCSYDIKNDDIIFRENKSKTKQLSSNDIIKINELLEQLIKYGNPLGEVKSVGDDMLHYQALINDEVFWSSNSRYSNKFLDELYQTLDAKHRGRFGTCLGLGGRRLRGTSA